MQLECDADHSLQTSAKVENVWRFILSPLIRLDDITHIHRDNNCLIYLIYFVFMHVAHRCARGDGRCTRLDVTGTSTSLPETEYSCLHMAICDVPVSIQWAG
jgi:hypothetical protein